MYSLTSGDAKNTGDMVIGNIYMLSNSVVVLFDSGVTHSFISRGFIKMCGLETQSLDAELEVVTPIGSVVACSKVIRDCPMGIQERMMFANLIVFDMHGFDIILGMDWVAANYASIDCHRKEVVFIPPGEQEFMFVGSCVCSTPWILSAIQARRLLLEGC
ncbi:uncharacterized protein LOC131147781 [Malania oleifera]|uniref:uncharacterized protein LOC131147781 n=1 Tax=Malania oleifera TaxID=397392 RepID=UPI0025ADC140|nr:uncharacterized protein LOC131147781 [Malania oleifera]